MAAEIFPKMSISAEWEVAKLWNHYFYRVFVTKSQTQNFQKFDQNCPNPYLSRLILEHKFYTIRTIRRDKKKKKQKMYCVYRGFKGFFWLLCFMICEVLGEGKGRIERESACKRGPRAPQKGFLPPPPFPLFLDKKGPKTWKPYGAPKKAISRTRRIREFELFWEMVGGGPGPNCSLK